MLLKQVNKVLKMCTKSFSFSSLENREIECITESVDSISRDEPDSP